MAVRWSYLAEPFGSEVTQGGRFRGRRDFQFRLRSQLAPRKRAELLETKESGSVPLAALRGQPRQKFESQVCGPRTASRERGCDVAVAGPTHTVASREYGVPYTRTMRVLVCCVKIGPAPA